MLFWIRRPMTHLSLMMWCFRPGGLHVAPCYNRSDRRLLADLEKFFSSAGPHGRLGRLAQHVIGLLARGEPAAADELELGLDRGTPVDERREPSQHVRADPGDQ